MKFYGSITGFAPPPGSGAIQQHNRSGQIVRMRNPSGSHAKNLNKQRWQNSRAFLRACAHAWDAALSGADRASWDTFPSHTPANGFERFMRTNKHAQGLAFTQPDASGWNGNPVYTFAPFSIISGAGGVIGPNPLIATPTSIKVKIVNPGFTANIAWSWMIAPLRRRVPGQIGFPRWRWQTQPALVTATGLYNEVGGPFIAACGALRPGVTYHIQGIILTTDRLYFMDNASTNYYAEFHI